MLEADGPAAALACFVAEPVDLLFTKVIRPGGMDGFALAQQAVAQWPRLKVVLTSGCPDFNLNGCGRMPGARLLNKPYLAGEFGRLFRETRAPRPCTLPVAAAHDSPFSFVFYFPGADLHLQLS